MIFDIATLIILFLLILSFKDKDLVQRFLRQIKRSFEQLVEWMEKKNG